MIYYFYGPDTYAARSAIAELAREKKARIRWLDKEDIVEDGPAKFISQGGRGLFGQEMVVVRDPTTLSVAGQVELLEAMEKVSAGNYVLWERAGLKKQGPMAKGFKVNGQLFPVLGSETLCSWLVGEAKKLDVTIEPDATRILVERTGQDRWRMKAELHKLALLKKNITAEVAAAAIPELEEAEIFSVLDALARGDKRQAVQGIHKLLKEGASEFYVLAMLAYQLRTLFIVRSGMDRGLRQFEIVREAKIKSYSVQKNWEAAKRATMTGWRDALTRVLATDFAIKQGRVDARTGVLMLVVGLG